MERRHCGELENLGAPCLKTQCERSDNAEKCEKLIFSIASGRVKLLGRDPVQRTSALCRNTPKEHRETGAPGSRWPEHAEHGKVREHLRGESDGSQPFDSIPDDS